MYWELIESRELFNGLECRLEASPDGESPNHVFGIWERADCHQAGQTVKDNDGRFWTSCNYSPAELSAEFAAQGRGNPSREAYESLRNELFHYLYGEMVTIKAAVCLDGEELDVDYIGTDLSDYMPESLEEAAERTSREHFDWRALVREARKEAKQKAATLSRVA